MSDTEFLQRWQRHHQRGERYFVFGRGFMWAFSAELGYVLSHDRDNFSFGGSIILFALFFTAGLLLASNAWEKSEKRYKKQNEKHDT